MKAILCREYGPPEQLELAEVAPLTPGKGQVVIAVQACGVNFPDTLIIEGKYQFKPPMPFTPGTDVAGVVKAVGEGAGDIPVGSRVVAFTPVGGFAEEVVCDTSMLAPIPDGPEGLVPVDFVTAAAYSMTYSTSYHALKDRAQIKPGETLLVLGAAGGVGLAAVDLAKVMGARVIAAASSDEKLALCRERGADATINYAAEDLRERLKDLTNGNGADVIYDPVGSQYAEPALRGMAWNGRYLVVGFAGGDIPRIPLNLPLLKGCAIVGVFWGGFIAREPERHRENQRQLQAWLADGTIKPYVSATYPLAEAAQALRAILDRKALGKVVLVTNGPTP
jgi:NADPH:quinone reductase